MTFRMKRSGNKFSSWSSQPTQFRQHHPATPTAKHLGLITIGPHLFRSREHPKGFPWLQELRGH
eukprot:12419633-Karenia_brevis.AAC.1